jgi:hypothetical protein
LTTLLLLRFLNLEVVKAAPKAKAYVPPVIPEELGVAYPSLAEMMAYVTHQDKQAEGMTVDEAERKLNEAAEVGSKLMRTTRGLGEFKDPLEEAVQEVNEGANRGV